MKSFLIDFFESTVINAEDKTEALELFAEHIKELRYGTICGKCDVEELDFNADLVSYLGHED